MMLCTKILADLVALPSVNPAFLPAGDPRAGEQRVWSYLAERGKKLGMEIQACEALPNRPNLLVRLTPRGKIKNRLLLAPHLDTVNGTDHQFRPEQKNGRLYGRGACDTKGSVAAMFAALCEVAQSGKRPEHTEIVFAGLVDEEHAQSGSRALARSGLKADLAIVGEPTLLKVVTAHKGSVWLRLEVKGKAAHGARPELGRNAVEGAAEIVLLLQRQYATGLAKKRHPLLGCGTISVGVINGGTQPNIVPDGCWLESDRRTLPGETEASVRKEVLACLEKHGLKAEYVNSKLAPCLPLETSARLPLVSKFLRACGQTEPAGVEYFCDASILSAGGIPSAVFGPGDIAQAHTADEWIAIASVEKAARMLHRFLLSLT